MEWLHRDGDAVQAPISYSGGYVVSHRLNRHILSYRPPNEHHHVGVFETAADAYIAAEAHHLAETNPLRALAAVFARRDLELVLLAARLHQLDEEGAKNPVTGRHDLDDVAAALWRACEHRDDNRTGAWAVMWAERVYRELTAPMVPDAAPSQQPDLRPGHYYVSALPGTGEALDGHYWLLAGPWPTHAEALAQVRAVWDYALRADPVNAEWKRYGTCRLEEATASRLGCDPVTWSPPATEVVSQSFSRKPRHRRHGL